MTIIVFIARFKWIVRVWKSYFNDVKSNENLSNTLIRTYTSSYKLIQTLIHLHLHTKILNTAFIKKYSIIRRNSTAMSCYDI